MENKETEVEELLDWMNPKNRKDSDFNIWELSEALDDPEDLKTICKIFSKDQVRFLRGLVEGVIWAVFEWHDKEDSEAHETIAERVRFLERMFEDHRHDFSKTYSSKAEV